MAVVENRAKAGVMTTCTCEGSWTDCKWGKLPGNVGSNASNSTPCTFFRGDIHACMSLKAQTDCRDKACSEVEMGI